MCCMPDVARRRDELGYGVNHNCMTWRKIAQIRAECHVSVVEGALPYSAYYHKQVLSPRSKQCSFKTLLSIAGLEHDLHGLQYSPSGLRLTMVLAEYTTLQAFATYLSRCTVAVAQLDDQLGPRRPCSLTRIACVHAVHAD